MNNIDIQFGSSVFFFTCSTRIRFHLKLFLPSRAKTLTKRNWPLSWFTTRVGDALHFCAVVKRNERLGVAFVSHWMAINLPSPKAFALEGQQDPWKSGVK